MGMWRDIRTRFQQALLEKRIDQWLVLESRNTGDLQTKWRELNDVVAFAKYLDTAVDKEDREAASGGNNGGIFVSFRGGCGV